MEKIEKLLTPLRNEGLEVVRYSPKEQNIPCYVGCDAMIRFYKDPEIYKGWIGDGGLVNFTQNLYGRQPDCHYDEIMPLIKQFSGKVYGSSNEELGEYWGGEIPFDQQLQAMKHARVMPYGGTWPAAYTLSFIEALMLGLPIVAISKNLADLDRGLDFYEVDEILAKISGPVCDSVKEMQTECDKLLRDEEWAQELSSRQRELAKQMFDKELIKEQWKTLLG